MQSAVITCPSLGHSAAKPVTRSCPQALPCLLPITHSPSTAHMHMHACTCTRIPWFQHRPMQPRYVLCHMPFVYVYVLPYLSMLHCLEQHDSSCDDAEGRQGLKQPTHTCSTHLHKNNSQSQGEGGGGGVNNLGSGGRRGPPFKQAAEGGEGCLKQTIHTHSTHMCSSSSRRRRSSSSSSSSGPENGARGPQVNCDNSRGCASSRPFAHAAHTCISEGCC